MKNKLTLLLMASLSTTTLAKDHPYLGSSFIILDYKEDNIKNSFTPTAIAIKVGYKLGSNLALEALLTTKRTSDSQTIAKDATSQLDAEFEITNFKQFRALGLYPINNTPVSVYGFLAHTSLDVKATTTLKTSSNTTNSITDTDSDIGFGGGIMGSLGHIDVFVEYGRYYSNSDNGSSTLNGTQLGLQYRF